MPSCRNSSLQIENYGCNVTNFDEVAGDVTASNVKSTGQMGECKSIIDWANVSDTVTGVNYHTSLQT